MKIFGFDKTKRHTLNVWSRLLNITILDPDGFNRNDRKLFKRRFTYTEFMDGMIRSTILPGYHFKK